MDKEELIKFLEWLEEEGIVRWYSLEDNIPNTVQQYLNSKNNDND